MSAFFIATMEVAEKVLLSSPAFPAHQNAVPDLEICQSDRLRIFQILLTRSDANDFCGVPNVNGRFYARIAGQYETIP